MQEIKTNFSAQMDEQKKNCIFCRIISKEIKSSIVYEDDLIEGILDINPCTDGHMLLFPKEHYPIIPFLPPETFSHMFGTLPRLINALKEAMLSTGANVFIANGAAAGQQSPHFLMHMYPREKGDSLYKFAFQSTAKRDEKTEETTKMLANNLPLMMGRHFQKNPAPWLTNDFKTAPFLHKIVGSRVYEDNKLVCISPADQICNGHLVIYSNEEEKLFENLSPQSAAHIFYTASFAATAVFEGLGASGSNIILKTGESDDNQDGRLSIHIIPRFQNDGLDILHPPKAGKADLRIISEKLRSRFFAVEYKEKKPEDRQIIDLDKKEALIIRDESMGKENYESSGGDGLDEIRKAVQKIKQG